MIVNRSIENFNGLAAVIGCTNHINRDSDCGSGNRILHADKDLFYTIDFNSYKQPDLVLDITGDLPESLENKFQLVLLECLDMPVYNSPPPHKGFNNIWSMVQENGFILIVGAPRWKESRRSLYAHNLRYIELDTEGEILLIPKNQNLTLEEINSNSSQLAPELLTTIDNASTLHVNKGNLPVSQRVFCEFKEKDIPSRKKVLSVQPYNDRLKQCIEEFVTSNKEKSPPSLHPSLEEFKLKSSELIDKATDDCKYCDRDALRNIAKTTFHHRHDLRRKFLDFLLKITLIVPLLSCVTRHSFYFMDAKTSRQKNFEADLNTFEVNNPR